MSSKHYFPSTAANTLVLKHLKALVSSSPGLELIEKDRVVYDKSHRPDRISLISGGGSGHEPAWSGYVGEGLLSAAVCGDIFASPSAKQVFSGIASVPSDQGTILLVTNYTGDTLHFGLAAEKSLASGLCKKLAVLHATDDVSIGRSSKVGRRGMPGNVLIMKILGAAIKRLRYSFEECVQIGEAINSQLVSIGSALDHCHVPGRQAHNEMSDDDVYIGSGIHNEPGAQRISPFPPTEEIINRMLLLLLDPDDSDRAFVKFAPKDEVLLLINNYGGLSTLELGALTQETLEQLESRWKINPVQRHIGVFETSLNGPGFSITLLNLSRTASLCSTRTSELLELLNDETAAPNWPNVKSHTTQVQISPYGKQKLDVESEIAVSEDEDIKVDPKLLEALIRQACKRAIEAEPNLTKWDTIMGDGDCGEGVKEVCEAIIAKLNTNIIPQTSGSIPTLLNTLLPIVENMGGTLGAIFGILLAAFSTHLRTTITNPNSNSNPKSNTNPYAQAFALAKASLKKHTGARVGDRTVMDAIIPFSETFSGSEGSFEKAVEAGRRGAEGTRGLKASFGRASYVGAEEGGEKVPDPGAMAFVELLQGIREGLAGGE